MSWARIHDTALSSPKIVKMFDPRDPFHLWVWGLSYCQTHLTDGAIPVEAIPHGGMKAAPILVSKRLWEQTDDGYSVHHYLDWNDSRDTITNKRSAARSRMDAARKRSRERSQRTEAEQIPRTSTDVLRGVASSSSVEFIDLVSNQKDPERERERKPFARQSDARSRRPIYTGKRLTVHEWQLEECANILGDQAIPFELDLWFQVLDDRLQANNQVLPKRDGNDWLQAELLAECERRGIQRTIVTAGKASNALPSAEELTLKVAARLAKKAELRGRQS